jgi:hypothetical protein
VLDFGRPTGAHVVSTHPDLTAAVRAADAYARTLAPEPDDD